MMMELMNVEPLFWIGMGAGGGCDLPDAGRLLDPDTENAEK